MSAKIASEMVFSTNCEHCGLLNIDGLVPERFNSSALAMELRLPRTNPSI